MPTRKKQAPPDFYLKARGAALTPTERRLIKEQAALVALRIDSGSLAVNIGVGAGGTMHCIRAGAPKCELIGVDKNPKLLQPQSEEFLQPLELILGNSHDSAIQEQCEGPVCILLIDGDHSHKSVRADIQGWIPKLVVGGVVMFHDYSHPQGDIPRLRGVRRAVEEWRASEGWSADWRESGHADSVIAFERIDETQA